jgi:hypothetical protein
MRFKQVLHNTPISSSHPSGFLTGKAVAAEVKKLLQPQRCCSQQGNISLRVRNSGRRGSTSDGKPPLRTENPHSSFVLSSPAARLCSLPLPACLLDQHRPSLSNHCNLFSPGRRSDGVMVRNCCRGSFLPSLCLDCISCPRACFLVRLRPSLYTFPILL